MSGFGNSYIVQHYSGHIEDTRDTLRDKPLTLHNVSANSISTPSSQSFLVAQGRLKVFNCDIILSAPTQISAVRTTFYDTSGAPTGTEPVLFSIISFAQKIGGNTEGFSQHSYNFPERGVVFENGIGSICEALLGTPTIAYVDANFGYVADTDDYP
jgi:hypothetical protein